MSDESPDTATRDVLASPPPRRLAASPPRPFAARVQAILIVLMFLGLALIAQQRNKDLYQFGLPLLVVAAFLQIAFGNIPPLSNFRKSILLLLISWAIVAVVFALGIYLAPTLIDLTRGDTQTR